MYQSIELYCEKFLHFFLYYLFVVELYWSLSCFCSKQKCTLSFYLHFNLVDPASNHMLVS